MTNTAQDERESDAAFQSRVKPWLLACFGEAIAGDREERNHRFLEEALKLVQACGCTASEAHQLVGYTFGREVGDPTQEVGGVMVTLAALCLANGIDMHEAAEIELTRIWTKVEKIRAKQAAKPKHSPLPESSARTAAPDAGADEVTFGLREALQIYRECGGTFHGPHVEHASCEEQAFHRFIEAVIARAALAAAPRPGWREGALWGLGRAADVAGQAAWRHEGDDAYSHGLDKGARDQVHACVKAIDAEAEALRSTPAAAPDAGVGEVTEAAANIMDSMMGGDRSWRERVSFLDCLGSTFLDSADWQTAVAYARAALGVRNG